ncbi:MAG: glycosyltransferase [Ignavibacteria bacterium]|nr:glycosyltransferase [Ignavibacteria bacterium]
MKILYIMGDSWYWIKQRPHFIAEYLSRNNEVDVVFEKRYTGKVKNADTGRLNLFELYKFPFTHNPFVKIMNDAVLKNEFKKYIVNESYDIIWFNSWKHFKYAEKYIKNGAKVVYDCMDDFTEFQGSKKNQKTIDEILLFEKRLCQRSDIVFSSSEQLKNNLTKRYGITNISVLNNAIDIPPASELQKFTDTACFKQGYFNILYTGSVSEWFDFDLINESLEKFDKVNYVLIGPSDVCIPENDRIVYRAPIEHRQIFDAMNKSDMLVMPFKKTKLVESVNPVKVYEYIYSGKPALILGYGETQKFGEYVYLYNSKAEYFDLLGKMTSGKTGLKKTKEESESFAKNNTWSERVKEIEEILMKAAVC